MRTRVVLLDQDMSTWSPPDSMDRTKAVFVYANCHSFRFAIDRKTKRSLVYATVMKMTNCYPPVDMLTTNDITNHPVSIKYHPPSESECNLMRQSRVMDL